MDATTNTDIRFKLLAGYLIGLGVELVQDSANGDYLSVPVADSQAICVHLSDAKPGHTYYLTWSVWGRTLDSTDYDLGEVSHPALVRPLIDKAMEIGLEAIKES
jgi:hypothetical protein